MTASNGSFVQLALLNNRPGGVISLSSSKPAVPSFNIEKSKTRAQRGSRTNAIRSRGGYCTCARRPDRWLSFLTSTIHVGSTDLALTSTRALRPGCQRANESCFCHCQCLLLSIYLEHPECLVCNTVLRTTPRSGQVQHSITFPIY